ncbi:putative L-lactate dehydrogenase operon regulatory protein [mine drainage metagenome]|uniref:Putative L-lactate dehydrogenase operon regulatory protein n=1 Tax=mine drainage metagenome TaxID=410659 RepID=A0A1J5R1T9_9ZZZZ
MTDDIETRAAGVELLARLLNSHPETAFDYLEFRGLLGGEAAAAAALRASEAELAHLGACLTALEEAHGLDDPAQEAQADARFHLAIYEAAHNAVMTHVMGGLLDMLQAGVFYDRADLYLRRGVRDSFLRQHQALYAAIAARNPEAARLTAKAHIAATAEALREAQMADHRRAVSERRAEGAGLTMARERAK